MAMGQPHDEPLPRHTTTTDASGPARAHVGGSSVVDSLHAEQLMRRDTAGRGLLYEPVPGSAPLSGLPAASRPPGERARLVEALQSARGDVRQAASWVGMTEAVFVRQAASHGLLEADTPPAALPHRCAKRSFTRPTGTKARRPRPTRSGGTLDRAATLLKLQPKAILERARAPSTSSSRTREESDGSDG